MCQNDNSERQKVLGRYKKNMKLDNKGFATEENYRVIEKIKHTDSESKIRI